MGSKIPALNGSSGMSPRPKLRNTSSAKAKSKGSSKPKMPTTNKGHVGVSLGNHKHSVGSNGFEQHSNV